MSVQALSWVFDEVRGLSPVQRLVLLSIANHADKYGDNAWPSIATIGEETDIARRNTVKDALRALRDEGWIEVEVNQGGDHRVPADKRPNLYRLPRMHGGAVGVPPTSSGGAADAARGGTSRSNGGAVGDPQTVHEPPNLNDDQAAIDGCEQCDKNGLYIPDVEDRHAPARKCDHRIGAAAGGRPIGDA